MARKKKPGANAEPNHDAPEAAIKQATPAQHKAQLVNTLSLWNTEAANASPQTLQSIRLDENERLLIPFTTTGVRKVVHFLNTQSMRGYIQCLGESCLACKTERQRETRDLVPFYDVVDRAIGVLAISTVIRPNALLPQLLPLLQRVESGAKPFVITLRKLGYSNFVVGTLPLPEGSDDGSTAIARFSEQMDGGEIDLSSTFQRLDNVVLQDIPEIATMMAMKGIARCGSDSFGL